MKILLLVLSMTFGLVAFANQSGTEAKWFSPDCKDCPKMLTPGTASLGNNKGVFRPGQTKKKPTTTKPVSTGK